MGPEIRNCQNCKKDFTIEPEDFVFYERIKMPPPTFCPDCRCVRRMSWRNERSLYRRKSLNDKDVITCFSPESGINVYDRDMWWSDAWDPLSYGVEYDFEKSFFGQYRELLNKVPMPALFLSRATNSDYCNHTGEAKNSYLSHACWGIEDSNYVSKCGNVKDSEDSLNVTDSELVYEGSSSEKIAHSFYIQNSENCTNSAFLYQCKGCNDCFGCTNLRGKSYHIFNQPYSKEEYGRKLLELDLGSYRNVLRVKEEFEKLKLKAIRKYANTYKVENTTGDNVGEASNCKACFDFWGGIRDCKFCINGGVRLSDSYDGYGIGETSELIYESVDTGLNGTKFFFDIFVWGGHNVQYSYASHGCQNIFACVALRNKQYCILNKQYTKEEYEALVPKIIEHMNTMPYIDKLGRVYKYGEFFPPELSPFSYNETIAQEYFPLTKEQALVQGYKWRDPDTKQYTVTKQPQDLPDHIKDTPDSILEEVIGCLHAQENHHTANCEASCVTAFKLIPAELQFYKRMNLSLPRLCPNCRHYERLAERNPLRLWTRGCMCDKPNHSHQGGCPNQFETSYAPDRPEIVYCESCYNSEVV